MNRELKFRAYDKVEKEMLTILEMDWYPNHTLRYLKAIDKDGKEWYYDSPDGIKENLTIEQFTGLKDKNGKEIYEGDIVKYQHLDDSYQHLLIKWLDADCMFDAGGYRIDLVAHRGEVTGNIYEDSQLLEADK